MMEVANFDFQSIANIGLSADEVTQAMLLLCNALNPLLIMTAPDGIPISDTEYADVYLGDWYEGYSRDK